MRVYTFVAIVIIAALAVSQAVDYNILSALAPHTPGVGAPRPGSTLASAPSSVLPTPLSVSQTTKDGLELRQAPGFGPIAAPPAGIVALAMPAAAPPAQVNPPAAVPPAVAPPATYPPVAPDPAQAAPTTAIPPANQAVPAAPPAAVPVPPLSATTTTPAPPLPTGDDFMTVQWIETHVGTLRTWVPQTYTFHFEATSQAPLPGVGSIGMGTLTGKTGQTQTIYVMAGAAQTLLVDSNKAVAAAVAVGIAGFMV